MSIKNLLPGKIGLGGAPLGNMFRAIPEDEAHATVSEAWNLGVRYFDTAPLYGSGVLAGGEHFEYQKASAAIQQKVAQINAIATRFNVNVKAAALQFALANPAVAAVIPGSSRPGRMAEDLAALNAPVPAEFWAEMRRQNLVAENAPLPTR